MVIGAARPVILIVEDDLRMRTLLKRLLEIEDNYTVELAANGTKGLTRVEAGGISPVLLDLMLPGMGGLELCRRVCALEREPYWPIIMVPGLDTEVDRHAGFEAGANDYIVKPFLATELRDRVQVWLRTRQFLEAAGERQQ